MSNTSRLDYVDKTFRAVEAWLTPGDPYWIVACVETGFPCNDVGRFESKEAAEAKADEMTAFYEDANG